MAASSIADDLFDIEIEERAIVFTHRHNAMTAVLAFAEKIGERSRRVLTPIRLISNQPSLSFLFAEALRQARNLKMKIRVVDALRLSSDRFATQFNVGRFLFSHEEALADEAAWQLIARCGKLVEQHLGVALITQPDYDQRQYHRVLGGMLDLIDFKTAHEPSAIGTAACFTTLLKHFGEPRGMSFGIIGLGNLGSRILDHLRSRTEAEILVCETDPVKSAAACRVSGVVAVPFERILSAPLNGIVFCANSGSLSDATASALAQNPHLFAAGGPEAGLDYNKRAVHGLTSAGKHFVPSVLCGAMGLVANLNEINDKASDVDQMKSTLEACVASLAVRAQLSGVCFHQAFAEYVETAIDVETPIDKEN